MYFNNGACTISDDDEGFCEDGMVTLYLNDIQFIEAMKELSKLKGGEFTKIYNELMEAYKSNVGFCCNREYHCTNKTTICFICGSIVRMT